MLAKEDPLSYVFHALSYIDITNPNATELEKANRLIDGLPRPLKAYFVRDTPDTVERFTARLKSVALEHAYKQPDIQNSELTAAAASALAGQATLNAALPFFAAGNNAALNKNILGALAKITQPVYANLPPGQGLAQQVADIVQDANKDAKIEALQTELQNLRMTQNQQNSNQNNNNNYGNRNNGNNNFSSNGNRGNYRNFGNRGANNNNNNFRPNRRISSDGQPICYSCGFPGHVSTFCPFGRGQFGQVNSGPPAQFQFNPSTNQFQQALPAAPVRPALAFQNPGVPSMRPFLRPQATAQYFVPVQALQGQYEQEQVFQTIPEN